MKAGTPLSTDYILNFLERGGNIYTRQRCAVSCQRGCVSTTQTFTLVFLPRTPLGNRGCNVWKSRGLLVILSLPGMTSVTTGLAPTRTWHREGQWPLRLDGNSLCSQNSEHEPREATPKCYSAFLIVNHIGSYCSHASDANINLTKYLHNFYNQMSNRQVYLFWRFLLLFHYLVAFHQALFTADKLTYGTHGLQKQVFSQS